MVSLTMYIVDLDKIKQHMAIITWKKVGIKFQRISLPRLRKL